ncbi:MAG: hypothetical protein V3W11_03325 [bacterium]
MPAIIEKIIAAHSSDDVHPGATVWLELDVRAARDFVVAYAVKRDGSLDGTWAGKCGSKLGTEKLTRE